MMEKSINILHLEDDENDAELILSKIKLYYNIDYYVRTFHESEFTQALNSGKIDLILADSNLPQFDGKEAIKIAKKLTPEIPFIVISGASGEYTAVETMKLGVTDYVLKNNLSNLLPAIKRALIQAEKMKQKQREEKERGKLFEEFKNIFDNLDEMIFAADFENKKFLYVSPSCEKIYGFGQEDFYKNFDLWKEKVLNEDKIIIEENIKLLHSSKPVEFTYRITDGNKKIRQLNCKIKPYTDNSTMQKKLYGIICEIKSNYE